MRTARVVAACVGLATTLTACNLVQDGRYFREGIGSELYRDELPDVTRLQDLYVAYICRQAGLAGPGETCVIGLDSQAWDLFVQAGMNDIDQRCDAYLAWLDDKKRSREPILKQLAAMGAATAGILKAADAGPKSLALAGIAFGLAAETFTNINSRLLQEIDHTTVQATVLDNQQRFRLKVRDEVVDNKPAAIFLLRSYLRICLPFSIEMDINNTVTVFHRAGAEGLASAPLLTRAPDAIFTTRFTPLTDVTTRIRAFVGSSPANQRAVEEWLRVNRIGMPIAFFLRSAAHVSEQRRMVRELRIR